MSASERPATAEVERVVPNTLERKVAPTLDRNVARSTSDPIRFTTFRAKRQSANIPKKHEKNTTAALRKFDPDFRLVRVLRGENSAHP